MTHTRDLIIGPLMSIMEDAQNELTMISAGLDVAVSITETDNDDPKHILVRERGTMTSETASRFMLEVRKEV